jgi:hypothetical protein
LSFCIMLFGMSFIFPILFLACTIFLERETIIFLEHFYWLYMNSDLRGMKLLSTWISKFDKTQHKCKWLCVRFKKQNVWLW